MWDFEHGSAGGAFEISYTLPANCAEQLRTGTADIGIIPAAAYVTIPDLLILPGVAIAARRAVRSILLVSKVPLEQIRSVALDTSSLTSVALTKVLFAKWIGAEPRFNSMPPDLDFMLRECDAGLLIGDPALQVDRSRYHTYDLAEEWIRRTGLPFVFAFWAVRASAVKHWDAAALAQVFQSSRDHGLEPGNVARIAEEWAPRLGISSESGIRYLNDNIYYALDPDCLRGLQLFYQYAKDCEALPLIPELRFLELIKPVVS